MLMIKNASINDNGMYRCSGTNEFGQDSKNSIITVTGDQEEERLKRPFNTIVCLID